MDEKKPLNKGIKLNASQLPLNNKADFVLGADSRKVLTNKILENLNSTAHHGHFPASRSGDYKSWSVSREFEIPQGVQEADAQMRMIEGADSSESLQNDNADPTFSENANRQEQYDPFFMSDSAAADQSAAFFESVASGSEPLSEHSQVPNPESEDNAGLSDPAADEPSPWGAPVFDNQSPAVIRHSQADDSAASTSASSTPSSSQSETALTPGAASDSPWGAPPGHEIPTAPSEVPSAHTPTETTSHHSEPAILQASSEITSGEDESDHAPGQTASPTPSGLASATPSKSADNLDSKLLPAWMTDLTSADDATAESGAGISEQAALVSEESSREEEFETLLNSIPNEEFIIDNETMRHLFASLIEPKPSYQIVKSAASEAADIAIAAAAAEILRSKVEIDAIPFDEIALEADDISDAKNISNEKNISRADSAQSASHVQASGDAVGSINARASHDVNASPTAADQDAIQKAYAMLDLTPLPQSQRKEELFDIVAAADPSAENAAAAATADSANAVSAIVLRSQRGTIEFATHADGRQLIPSYNACGMLIGVQLSDGVGFALSEEKNVWQMTDANGRVMQSGITSVSFDKQANLSYTTKSGDSVILKVDGSIETKYAKSKKPSAQPAQVEDLATPAPAASDLTLELEKPVGQDSKSTKQDRKGTKPEIIIPESKSTKQDRKGTKPEIIIPESKSTKHEGKGTKPESAPTKPESKSAKPENKATKPESKSAKPENKATKPDSKSAKPENKATKPDSKSAKPDSKAAKPSSKSTANKPKPKPKKSR